MSKNDIKDYSDFKNRLIGEELKSYKKIKHFQDYFDDIAKYIFGNVAIVIGEGKNRTIYYLEEIEFYYNNLSKEKIDSAKGTKGRKITEEEKRYINHFSCTYKRDKKANQLFWHYSGVDICFESDMKENCYGGILIRSLTKDKGNSKTELIAGPLRCSNELINQAVLSKCIPQIEEIKRSIDIDNIGSTVRQGIETAERYKEFLDRIYNENDRKDFPFFCYFIKRKEGEKWVNYSSIPEKRAKYIRSIV